MWCMLFSKCRLSVIFVAIAIKICPKLFSISTEHYFNSRSKEWSKEHMFPTGVLNELSFTIPDDELLNAPVALWISWMNQCSFYPMTNVLLKAAATKVNVIGL